MAIVSSFGALTAIASPAAASPAGVVVGGPYYDGYRRSYAEIYRTQPAVRTVVDFFSRNIAQLGLQLFERRGDLDRVRLTDRPLVGVFRRPNPGTSRYRFIESTVQDMGVYANAYWLKVRARPFGLVRVPAAEMQVAGGLIPESYTWTPASGRGAQPFAPSEIVHFRLYDPANPLLGFPPIETLRRVLAEAIAAGDYRQAFWRNAARVETVIERPKDAPRWAPEQREVFRAAWQEFAGKKAGMTPVLEDGMTLKAIGTTFKDSEYIGSRKLSREEVAAAYHVPLPMVGILDHATFSNIREQHKQLYQDCLGPWLTMLEEDIELQLLPEFEDPARVYVEFNIQEKLKGSFEEQTTSLGVAIGRPFMTVNEGRARLNLPRDADPKSDQIAEVSPGQGRAYTGDAGARQALRAALAEYAAAQTARLQAAADADARSALLDEAGELGLLVEALVPVLGVAAVSQAAVIVEETRRLIEAGAVAWSEARVAQLVDRVLEAARA